MKLRYSAVGLILLAATALALLCRSGAAAAVKVGDRVPAIPLPGTDGRMHGLRNGRWTVLAWYPKAFTSG